MIYATCVSSFLIGLITAADANWVTWNSWSECSVSCGDGVQTRERTCVHTDSNKNNKCSGPSIMYSSCNLGECNQQNGPVTDVWSVWGDWSICSKTCGGGIHVRTRSCLLGDVSSCCVYTDTEGCEYEHYQTRECVNEDCQGEWSVWGSWSKCSVPCGGGNQTRERDCVPDDTVCPGPQTQTRSCFAQCVPTSSGLYGATSCSHTNPCQNGGICARSANHATCFCQGDWRGSDCGSLCLRTDQEGACINKEGIFHMCNDCTKFVICSRGRPVPMNCVEGRMWTGDGCKLPSETTSLCLEW